MMDIIVLGINSGLSQEEIMNLKWQSVDLSRRVLVSTREKTDVTRTIPLCQRVISMLTGRARVKSISGYVFHNGAHKRIDRWKLKSQFNAAVKAAGIAHLRFHDLRHTFATRLVQAGVDIYKVSKLLGHKDIATTQRYAHHYPESLRDGVEVLDRCYNSATVEAASGR